MTRKLVLSIAALSILLQTSCGSLDQGSDAEQRENISQVDEDSSGELAESSTQENIVEETLGDEAIEEELADSSASEPSGTLAAQDATTNEFSDTELGLEDAASPHEDSTASTAMAEPTAPVESSSELGASNSVSEQSIGSEPQASASNPVRITNLRYVGSKSGGTIIVDGTGPMEFETREAPDRKQIVIEVPNSSLPAQLKRPYITKDFQQNIASVNAYHDKSSNSSKFVIQMNKMSALDVQAEGNSLVIVSRGMGQAQVKDEVAQAEESDFQNEIQEEKQTFQSSASGQLAHGGEPDTQLDSGGHFTGKAISLEVNEAEVNYVLDLISEQTGANLVVDDSVKGKVTLKLREVPWDQALSLILKTKNLGYRNEGNVIRIASQEKLSKEDQDKRKQQDDKFEAEQTKVKVIPVSYAKVEEIENSLRQVLSRRGKVTTDQATSSIIINDVDEYIQRAERLIKSLDVAPRQVLIEGKIIEARDSFVREAGINLSLNNAQFVAEGGQFTGRVSSNTEAFTPSGLNVGLTSGALGNFGNLSAFLTLSEEKQDIKVISSPRIVTINNKAAKIRQVTQFPITQAQITNGITVLTTTFKDMELLLDVTPQITFEGNVIMKVIVKREFAGAAPNSSGAREVNTRNADTSVLVPTGQTAVIGGIYQSDAIDSEQGIPWVKDIPILGRLFKKTSRDVKKNELLIFLTPRILSDKIGGAEAKKELDEVSL